MPFKAPSHGVYTLRTRPFRFQGGYEPLHTDLVGELCEDGIETGTALFLRASNQPIVEVRDGVEVAIGANMNLDVTGKPHAGDWDADHIPEQWEKQWPRLIEAWESRKEAKGIGFLD
jgi:hypothetical protein